MKKILTLALVCVTALGITKNVKAQNCNATSGGNGNALALANPVVVDGNMADWAPYLNDPDNNSWDNTNGIDLDLLTITNPGRNLVRFTFTEDLNNLYFYLERANGNNNVDVVFYVDVNNNDVMESREPVYHISWQASSGNITINYKNYNPSLLSILVNTLSLNLDGAMLLGTLSTRTAPGAGTAMGKGSADGKSIEMKIPFTQITRLNATGTVINQLAFAQNFKFHVSTINGNISSVPGLGSIDDNFGGCLTAPTVIVATLPVKLASFTATLSNNNKTDLKWITASEINVSHFVIERSFDGTNFSDVAMMFAYGNATDMTTYSFSDNLANISSSIVYYRLKSVDIDGKVQYSEVRVIRIAKGKENSITILTFPNPVQNELRVTIPAAWQNKTVTYEIVSATGQVIRKTQATSSSQTETINVKTMARGFYVVKATCGTESAQQKIVKQ